MTVARFGASLLTRCPTFPWTSLFLDQMAEARISENENRGLEYKGRMEETQKKLVEAETKLHEGEEVRRKLHNTILVSVCSVPVLRVHRLSSDFELVEKTVVGLDNSECLQMRTTLTRIMDRDLTLSQSLAGT